MLKASRRVFGVTQHYVALLVKPEDEVMNAPKENPLTDPAYVRQLFRDAYKTAKAERKNRR